MNSQRKRRVMIFSCDRAFRRLRKSGKVLTARSERKVDAPVWIARERGGTKEFDAIRSLVAALDRSEFHEFAESARWAETERYRLAGFSSASEWVQKLRELQDGQVPEKVYVYEVRRAVVR